MFRQTWIYAYDVLDQVQVVVRVQESPEPNSHSHVWSTLCSTSIQSTGEDDAREWVRDALIAALEAL